MKILILILLIGLTKAIAADTVVNKEFLDGYNKFVSVLYKDVAETKPENFLISPISVDILLALAEYGSAGETSKQIMKTLHLPVNKEKIREAFTALTPQLNSDGKYILSSANKIYVLKGIPLLEPFKEIAVTVYNAGVENIDFLKSEAAANTMNKWVEENTHDKIKDLVDKDQITRDTRAFFLNALYFRGTWVHKFNPTETKKQKFYLNNKDTTEVDLMEITNNYKFHEDNEAKFLELPYDGNDVTMTIVLPKDKDGLKKMQDKTSTVLELTRYKLVRVHAKVPKFKIETKIELNDVLIKMGIVNAFDEKAEFPKITGEKLMINKAIQKCFIEVDEKGTTAAAATSIDEVSRSAHVLRETEEFIADHPFMFYLKYKSVILFIGQYTGK